MPVLLFTLLPASSAASYTAKKKTQINLFTSSVFLLLTAVKLDCFIYFYTTETQKNMLTDTLS